MTEPLKGSSAASSTAEAAEEGSSDDIEGADKAVDDLFPLRGAGKEAFDHQPNTDERFDLNGYLRANCDYPGRWSGEVEKIASDGSWSVAKVPLRGAGKEAFDHQLLGVGVDLSQAHQQTGPTARPWPIR